MCIFNLKIVNVHHRLIELLTHTHALLKKLSNTRAWSGFADVTSFRVSRDPTTRRMARRNPCFSFLSVRPGQTLTVRGFKHV